MRNYKCLLLAVAFAMGSFSAMAFDGENTFDQMLQSHDPTSGYSQDDSSIKYVQSEATGEGSSITNLKEGTRAYVGVYGVLNVREAPWGTIFDTLNNNEPVDIVGKEGNWYIVTSPCLEKKGYVYGGYIFNQKDLRYKRRFMKNPTQGNEGMYDFTSAGGSETKVVRAAKDLVRKYSVPGSFPYDPLTQGGNLGCAQVVSTTLKNAGVKINVSLGCSKVKGDLLNLGYKIVNTPPFRAGDVIFWSTYDSSGDGKNDPDTHIGIVMESGNNVRAMSNSSSEHRPRIHSATYCPVTSVVRRC